MESCAFNYASREGSGKPCTMNLQKGAIEPDWTNLRWLNPQEWAFSLRIWFHVPPILEFPIWLWLTVRHGKIHHFFQGKPSISIRAIYTMAMLVITRGYTWMIMNDPKYPIPAMFINFSMAFWRGPLFSPSQRRRSLQPTRFRDTMKSKDRAELLAVEQTATDLLRRQNADKSCECE